jgi:putative oxidoreductase
MSMSRIEDALLLLGRILMAWLFVWAGWGKIFTTERFAAYAGKLGMPYPEWAPYLAILIEFVGGIILLIGYQTRLFSWLFVVFVAVATYFAHLYWLFPPDQVVAQANNFYKNLAIIGGLLALAAAGGGRFSVDAMVGRRKEPATATA